MSSSLCTPLVPWCSGVSCCGCCSQYSRVGGAPPAAAPPYDAGVGAELVAGAAARGGAARRPWPNGSTIEGDGQSLRDAVPRGGVRRLGPGLPSARRRHCCGRSATGEAQAVTVARRARRGVAGRLPVPAARGRRDLPVAPMSLERPLVRLYRCRDGRWIHLHGEFAHLGAPHVRRSSGATSTAAPRSWPSGWPAGTRRRSRTRWPPPGRAAPWRAPSAEWSAHPQARGHRTAGPGQRREDRGERARGTSRRAAARSTACGCST